MSTETTPRPFVIFSVVLTLSGLMLTYFSLSTSRFSLQLLLLLAAAVLLSENFALEVPGVGSTSISYPLTMAATIVMGPAAGGLVAVLSGVNLRDIRAKRPPIIMLFNVAQLMLSATLAGLMYLALGGRLLLQSSETGVSTEPFVASDFPLLLAPLVACAVISFLMNDLLVAVALSLLHKQRLTDIWFKGIVWMLPTQVALAIVGFTIAQVLAVEIMAFALFVFPLIVARQVYQNYLSLKSAYVDTIRSLVNVLEAKDPYTRGHSVRVAEYARQLSTALGLDAREVDRTEAAAILHDLGKLSMPRAILVKPGPLTDEEAWMMRSHPEEGAKMVTRIPLLRDVAAFVAAHHCHYGGGGYGPDLSGDDIPLISRVLAVADSYDAMTTARSYRPALPHMVATKELERCSGTQFDPAIVDAFLAAGICAQTECLPLNDWATPQTERAS